MLRVRFGFRLGRFRFQVKIQSWVYSMFRYRFRLLFITVKESDDGNFRISSCRACELKVWFTLSINEIHCRCITVLGQKEDAGWFRLSLRVGLIEQGQYILFKVWMHSG